MKARDYREMSPDELEGKLAEQQRHLFDLRCQAVTEKLENSKAIRNAKREIARLKTVIREREISTASASANGTRHTESGQATKDQ